MGTQTTSRAYVPRNCVWEITRGCTLHCAHCGSEAGARRRGELDTAECLDVIAQLAALGTERITLSGGEPTLRPDWVTLARAITAAGMFVNLVTNGQGDPERFATNAVAAGLANVGVSIDGLRATHDALRGEGTFDRAMATVRALATRGVWVDVMVTVHRENLLDIEGLYDELVTAGARGMRFQLAKPMGSLTGRDDLTLRPAALLTLIPRLGRLSRRGAMRVAVGDSLGYYGPDDRAA